MKSKENPNKSEKRTDAAGNSKSLLTETELGKVPDLSLIQIQFDIKHGAPHVTEKAKADLLSHIKRFNMAPFYKSLCDSNLLTLDKQLYSTLDSNTQEQLKDIEDRLKDPTQSLGESEIYELNVEKAILLTRIGEKNNALSALRVIQEKAVTSGSKLDVIFAIIRIGFFFNDSDLILRNLEKAQGLIEQGGDWDRRNRLKSYQALNCIRRRDFSSAAILFSETLSTFNYNELMAYKDYVKLAVVSCLLSFSRVDLKAKILVAPEVLEVLDEIPHLREYMTSFYECRYKDFFAALAAIEQSLKQDHWTHPHYRYVVKEMKIKAYIQLLASYKSVTLASFADAFGVSVDYIDQELFKWISSGRINAVIDKVTGTVETTYHPDTKNAQYQQIIKNGDLLLNRLQKLSRVIHA